MNDEYIIETLEDIAEFEEMVGPTCIASVRIALNHVAEKNKKWYNKRMNKQISLSNLEDELSQVRTKKKEFLEQIERIVRGTNGQQ